MYSNLIRVPRFLFQIFFYSPSPGNLSLYPLFSYRFVCFAVSFAEAKLYRISGSKTEPKRPVETQTYPPKKTNKQEPHVLCCCSCLRSFPLEVVNLNCPLWERERRRLLLFFSVSSAVFFVWCKESARNYGKIYSDGQNYSSHTRTGVRRKGHSYLDMYEKAVPFFFWNLWKREPRASDSQKRLIALI